MNTSHLCLITSLWSSVYIKIYCYATQTCCYPKFYCSELLPSQPPNHKAKVMEHLVLKLFVFFLLLSNFVVFFSLKKKNKLTKKSNDKKQHHVLQADFFFYTEINLAWKMVTIGNVCYVKLPDQIMSISITILSVLELWLLIPSRALRHIFYLSFLLMSAPHFCHQKDNRKDM